MHWNRIYFLFDVSILNIKRGFVLLSFLNALCYTKEKIGRKEGTAVEIILWIIDLLIPSAFLLLGLYFTIAPVKERNKTKGYRTNLSLKTQETWNYAQRIFAVIWMIFGVCLAGLIVLCNFIIPISHEIRSVIFVVASISVMMCCTPITEGMIKRKFRGQLNGL